MSKASKTMKRGDVQDESEPEYNDCASCGHQYIPARDGSGCINCGSEESQN